MRRRFRVGNKLFAAETFAVGDHFEVKVFPLYSADGYFKREGAKPVTRLRGCDEDELLRLAISTTRACLQK